MLKFLELIWFFLESLFDIIVALIQFVIDFTTDLSNLINMTLRVTEELPYFFWWVPGPVGIYIGLLLTCVVFYKILGREG